MSVESEEHGKALINLMANVDSEGKPYIQELAGLKDAERVNTFLYMAKKWEYHYRKMILKDL
jgi:hypothetical protein